MCIKVNQQIEQKDKNTLKQDQATNNRNGRNKIGESSFRGSQNKSNNPISNNSDSKTPPILDDTQEDLSKTIGNLIPKGGGNMQARKGAAVVNRDRSNIVENALIGNEAGDDQQYSEDEDNSYNNILANQDQYDDDESMEDGGNMQSMYSHVVSFHPLSIDEGYEVPTSQRSSDSVNEKLNKSLTMSKRELAPLIIYQVLFLISITVPPLMLFQDCRSSPHYISHIIFLVLQVMLLVASSFYHKRKNASKLGLEEGTSLLRSQGRCCREVLSQMKLIDSYTNLCFYSLVLYERDHLPIYIFIISTASAGLFIVFKVIVTVYFIAFATCKAKNVQNNHNNSDKTGNNNKDEGNEDFSDLRDRINSFNKNSKLLSKLLIWLDQETIAKLYDPDSDYLGESHAFSINKKRYSYLKTLIEDAPMASMQAVYLAQELCTEGLNSVIIVSLYFNSICILYALSNFCSSRNKDGTGDKAYKKEIGRLREYYDGNQARVIAEFYIEDQNEIQTLKMKALNDYLAYHEYDVESFNFSTNQLGDETLNYLYQIVVNSSESLEDLALSRCRLKSQHLSYFYFPQGLIRLNLSENRIGDRGVKLIQNYILEKNRESLISLNLEHNFISDNGALMLLKAVQQSAIFNINLRKNRIGIEQNSSVGGLILEFYKALQINFIRHFVKKRTQGIGSKLQEQFNVRLSANETLDRILVSLFKVDFQQTVRNLDLSMRFFRTLRQNLEKEKTAGQGVAAAAAVLNNNISKAFMIKGLQYYDDEQRLLLIAIHHNANLPRMLPERERSLLENLPSKNYFFLGNSVNSVNLSSNWFSNRAQSLIITSLANFLNLRELVYNNNYIKNSALFFKCLADCAPTLELLSLKSSSFYGFYEMEFKQCFSKLASLRYLLLSYSNVSDTTILTLADSIANMYQLQKINLKQCGVSYSSLDQLFETLTNNHNSTLQSLNLSQNNLRGIQNLGKFIKQSKSLEKMKLAKTQLSDNELKQISYGLKINKSLQILDLSQNQIQNVGQIKDGLSCNIALEKLDLSSNVIDDSGLSKLSESLITNGCLETISISFNNYQLKGLSDFFKIFEENETLKNISFSIPNDLSDRDQSDLCRILLVTLSKMKGSFTRLEILGNVKNLQEQEFFYKFVKDGTQNIQELILDSILNQNQLADMVKALNLIMSGPQNEQELERYNSHKLKRITFIKPQEFNEEIQMLENLLEEKQNLFFLPQQMQVRMNKQRQIEEQRAAAREQQNQMQFSNNFQGEEESKASQQQNNQQQQQQQLQINQNQQHQDLDVYDDVCSSIVESSDNTQRGEEEEEENSLAVQQMKVPDGNQIKMGKKDFKRKKNKENDDNDNRI